ncbi:MULTISPECIES: MerR family transcriptional regulator [unclassified Oceanispirochaeta]|uniref:MerR family transcriptional regulator n=1 Tax=unclassified Oceanispirochaeta TaxID=2635722 RepID=UPI000E096A4C|nr:MULTISPECIES: MerR family transcriptional regulator [unclassified Oceanispirochaeta]MBF9016355.1 MerR family transcriptional regulator [Oceanispirochaeta sp. M2]NPD72817.1 MerR family transcriptional regulator [Oceanispirochaeta sp. M1]RDG31661.1 MerR family transcriptional regulator [Oceanispirochaeta sp. M1]
MTNTESNAYSMKEVKDLTGLSDHTLRYYEKDGILAEIRRQKNGHRRYEKQDLDWLDFVICLRSTGMPLSTIRKYRELMEQGDSTAEERKDLLLEQKESLLEEITTLQDSLKRISFKIDYYDQLCSKNP